MTKPVTAIITDTHLSKDNTEVILDVFKQFFALCVSLGLKEVIHMGDWFTNRVGQGLSVLRTMVAILNMAEEQGISIISIAGNHDKTNLDDEASYLDIYTRYSSLRLMREECVMEKGGKLWCFLPYFRENGTYPERLRRLHKSVTASSKDAYLFTHIAVNGVKNNDGSRVENELKYKHFGDFTKVFVGHYHNKTRIGKNIYYIGSARPMNYGEDNEKGFTVLYSDGTHEQHAAKFKKYIKVHVDANTVTKQELSKLLSEHQGQSDYIRFVFSGSTENLHKIDENMFKGVGIDVKKEDEHLLRSMEAASEGKMIEFTYKTIKQNFFEYCSKNDIKGDLRKRGMGYLDILKEYQ